jgi:RHS repeat-associated protein
MLSLAAAVAAQTTTTTSVTDGRTPSGLQPGSPAGSFVLSGFDNVNLYNGNLNFRLPLLKVGGRGSAGYSMMLALNLKSWHTKHTHKDLPDGSTLDSFVPTQLGWTPYSAYGAGSLTGRNYGLQSSSTLSCRWYGKTLARLTFSAADGTEYELRDQLTNGQPLTSTCNQGAYRGTVFVTADANSATFISDTAIYDIPTINPLGPTGFNVSGYLMLRDGTRYRIDGGSVTWISDCNGNKVSFAYTSNSMTVTDSLNRTVTVNYNVSDVAPYGLCDQIIYSGFGGAQRVIRVSYTDLASALRPGAGYTIKTLGGANGLFPELNASSSTTYNPTVTSSVWLPDGRRYRLYYNNYGELARFELPTGGAVEYDMTPDSGVSYACSLCNQPDDDKEIYRRVVERRVYPDGSTGSTFEHKDVYTNFEAVGTTSSTVTIEQTGQGGDVLARSRHYFDGSALNSMFTGDASYPYGAWYEGNERQTDGLDTAGNISTAPVLRQVLYTRAQRTPVSWWASYASTYGLDQSKEPPSDPRLITTVTTVEPGGANLVAKQTSVSPLDGGVGFDQYNNPTDLWEYDYGQGAAPARALRHTHTDYLTINNGVDYTSASGAHLRSLPVGQQVYAVNPSTGAETIVAKSEMRYDESAYSPLPCDPNGVIQCSSVPQWVDPGTGARGNATSVRSFINASTSADPAQPCPPDVCVETHARYDQLGNVRYSWDARGNKFELIYGDSFCNGTTCGTSGFTPNTFAFLVSTKTPKPDPSGTYGSATELTSTTVYDFYSGCLYSTTDANNRTTRIEYEDQDAQLGRVKAVVRPDGGRTDFYYDDTVGNLHVGTLSDLDAGRRTEARQYFDGLGRAYRKASYENSDASKPWLNVDTAYDALGRVSKTSTPYRSAGGGTPLTALEWSNAGRVGTEYDSLGRVLKVTTMPDGAVVQTDYSGDRVLMKEQTGRERVSRADALGRLKEVWEVTPHESGAEASTVQLTAFPNHPEATYGYLTSYVYDALGNLRMTEQSGHHLEEPVTQRRFFAYDSLGRLVREKHPEQDSFTPDPSGGDFPALTDSSSGVSNSQWSAGYIYDANGNLKKRRDARNTDATFGYDALNRNISLSYSDSTMGVGRVYDHVADGLGRLSWVWTCRTSSDCGVLNTYSYDLMGRVAGKSQQFWTGSTWGQPYTTSYSYNLAGGVTSTIYPSTHAVHYNYDAAGRLGDNGSGAAFYGNLGDSVQRTYASSVLYDPLGGMSQEQLGTDTALYHKMLYNSRGQLAEIRVGLYPINDPDPTRATSWQRGAIINHYSDSGWGASGGGPDNNGNLRRQDVLIPNLDGPGYDQSGGFAMSTQSFYYDSLNRLSSASESSAAPWAQSYTYDRFGNRTINAGGTSNAPSQQFSVDAATNRLGVPSGGSGSMSYDNAGNLTADTYSGAGVRAYDAEGRMVSAQLNSSRSAVYTYDPDGRRVKRNSGSGEVWQVYGIGGDLLAEYVAGAAPSSPQEEYGYRSGELLVTATVTGGWGAAPVIHDNPLVVRQTVVQSRHITELRDAINALRSHLGLSAYPWQTNASVGAPIKADPIVEMRTALDQALGAPSGGYRAGLAQGQPIQSIHIQELRDRVLNAWQGGTGGVDIRWLVADQLGTPRMVIDKTGSLSGVRRHDYLPFGEEIVPDSNWRTEERGYLADTVRQQFTGKERDDETGLDYFEARYYSSVQGRFTGFDPTMASFKRVNPQALDRYAYALNNPLRNVDRNGEWPTAVHEWIVDHAYWKLSGHERDVIKRASKAVDHERGAIDAENAYKHGERRSSDTLEQAADRSDQWIKDHQEAARNACSRDESLDAFGGAFHTVTDETSPSHIGYSIWRDMIEDGPALSIPSWADHVAGESSPSFFEMGFAVGAAQRLYLETYGPAEYNRATGGITAGSAGDPNLSEIEASARDEARWAKQGRETGERWIAEALFDYRLGVQAGWMFDYHRQRNCAYIESLRSESEFKRQ